MGLKKYLNSIISNFNWMGENIIVYLMGIVFSIIRDNILLNNSDVKLNKRYFLINAIYIKLMESEGHSRYKSFKK